MNILIVGKGRVGTGLRRALVASQEDAVRQVGRRWRASDVANAEVIIVAVSDDAIHPVADRLAGNLPPGAAVLHCAGAQGVDVLQACAAQGAAVGVMHPMVSFPTTRAHPDLRGTTFTLHGTRAAVAAAKRIAKACGARAVVATTGDPAYHAAAALTANGAVALAFASVSTLERIGFDRRAAERAIGGLLVSVGQNIDQLGVPDALTGPIARGEPDVVARHRGALRRMPRGIRDAYDAIVPAIVSCARAAGLRSSAARAILRTLDD